MMSIFTAFNKEWAWILKVGDTVVYPHHGAAVVEAIEQREMRGEVVDYLVLQIHQSDLTVRVPQ